jgi:transcriptional regulator with XRE-family HTH domain
MEMTCKMPYMSIGLRIKQARLASKPKITQQQLADAVNVSRPAVTQWETGETKTLEGENLVRVAQALGVTTEWLLYGTGPGPGEPLQPKTAAAANDQQVALSQRALLMAQAFDQLCPEQQDALQALLNAFARSKPPQLKLGSHDG